MRRRSLPDPLLRLARPNLLIWAGAVILSVSILIFSNFFLKNLREDTLHAAEQDLMRHWLTLAEQADRSFKSVDLVIGSVADHVFARIGTGQSGFNQYLSGFDTHTFLREKLSGLPQVDAITIIDASGKLINFSRYWPIPEVNVSDRDYYKALLEDPHRSTFISVPVPNRGTGTSTIYMARRLSDAQGAFAGLVLGAMTLKYFEDFYGSTSLGEGSAISLMRDDGTMLVRHPPTQDVGKQFPNAPRILGPGRTGLVREASPIDQQNRIKSAHRLANFPLFVLATQTEESILRSFHSMAELLLGLSLGLSILLLIAAFLIVRWWRQQQIAARISEEKALAEKARAEAEAGLLRERERAAEAASQAKSSFLAVMSHEIRTPMNAVLGLTSALLESPLSDDQRKMLQTIHDSGDGLLEILNDILDYSKLDAAEVTLESIAFSPQDIAGSVVSIVGPRATAKGLLVTVDSDETLPEALLGDPGRLRQVLLNLVSNAVKFTTAGGVCVKCRCLERRPSSALVEWSVSDTGIGIAADRIGTLFKDFVQADCTINRRFGGSGLGLSICRRIVERMSGQIDVQSVLGEGTTMRFVVELPVAEPVPTVVRPDDDGAGVALCARIAAIGRPLRMLITDDNPTNRLVAARMLKEFDIQFNMAADGTEAVSAVVNFPTDIVLMDLRMPEMDGLAATRAIRSRGYNVPIIAFTANAFADDVEAARAAGMNDFVAKPVRKAALLAAMVRVLDQGEPVGVAAPPAAAGLTAVVDSAVRYEDTPAFNKPDFDELAAALGEEGLAEALAAFLDETSSRIEALVGYELSANRAVIGREAHTIKGTAATFGFRRLSEVARQMERRAAEIDSSAYADVRSQLVMAFQQGKELLLSRSAHVLAA